MTLNQLPEEQQSDGDHHGISPNLEFFSGREPVGAERAGITILNGHVGM